MPEHIGKYIVEKKLGAGAFGDVFQVRDPDLQKSMAIKKLKVRTQAGESPEVDTKILFTKEAIETSKLSHPNIVTVHGFGTDETDGAPYLVMEYLEGETLEKFISNRPGTPLVEKLEIMEQVAEGLQFAHTRGVRHRDIKPANIMILSDGTAKVLDFAVAPEGFVVGTPAYMAPEQFAGQSSDIMTDVFSYGAVYYELLTGERAYDPNRPDHAQTSLYEPPRVAKKVEECPAWLDDVIVRLMAKRREDRVESLEDMLLYTRPILRKLKNEHASELAAGISPLIKAGKQEAADRLIDSILRLDPLNREARDARGNVRADQRAQARVRSRELAQRGQVQFGNGDFEKAQKSFEDALALDSEAPGVMKLRNMAWRKAEDQRTASLLLDEVIQDIIDAGPGGMLSFQVKSAINKLNRAASLDPRCRDVVELRAKVLPVYEQIVNREMASANAHSGTSELYEKRLKDARRVYKNARAKEEYDYAENILRGLMQYATDDRAVRELSAVIWDRNAYIAAQDTFLRASVFRANGDLKAALQTYCAYADLYPRRALTVQQERRKLEAELETLEGTSENM